MSATSISPEEIKVTVGHLKKVVASHGSASVIWALSETFGRNYRAEIHHIEKVVGTITQTGQYIENKTRDGDFDYEIKLNPNYEFLEGERRTNRSFQEMNEVVLPGNFKAQNRQAKWSIILAAISGIFIAVSIIVQVSDKTPQNLKAIESQLRQTSSKLEEVKEAIKNMRLEIKPLKTDSLLAKVKKP